MRPVDCGCGGKAHTLVSENQYQEKWYQIECIDCHTRTMPCLTEGEAIYTWNKAVGGRRALNVEDAIGFHLFPTDPEIIAMLEEKFKEQHKKYEKLEEERTKEKIAELQARIDMLKDEIALTGGDKIIREAIIGRFDNEKKNRK